MLHVQALDHIVLAVADIEASLGWYGDLLGLAPVRLDEWRAGDAPFPSLRINPDTIIDLIPAADMSDDAAAPRRANLDHLCLVVTAADLELVRGSDQFTIVRDPDFALYGAHGLADGLYVVDPDGNEVELRAYPDA